MHSNTGNQPSVARPFVLAKSVRTPVAATSLAALLEYGYELVGSKSGTLNYRDGRVREASSLAALKLNLPDPPERDAAPLWTLPDADLYYQYLHGSPQLWVHVDYDGYRKAWVDLKMEADWGEPLVRSTYLDHIQNRDAARLRDSIYPYIRLAPVPHSVNSSAGNMA